jgi:pentatricopeptide repeat protein
VLFCIVESGQSDVATYVGTLFRNMKGRYLRGNETFRPDAATYNVVLGAYTREMKMDEAELFLEEIISDHLSGNRAAKPMMRELNRFMICLLASYLDLTNEIYSGL